MRVEIHTNCTLEKGQILKGRLGGVGSSEGVIIKGKIGIRDRDITYINEVPEYTSITSSDVVAAMKESKIDEAEFVIDEVKQVDANGRNIYLLKPTDKNLLDSLTKKSPVYARTERKLDEWLEDVDSDETTRLVKIALSEVKESLNCAGVVKQFYVQGAATQGNPNKGLVINLIKEGNTVPLELCKTKTGIIGTVYEGKRAGEVVLEDGEDINLSDVKSVKASKVKSWGYYIDVEMISNEVAKNVELDAREQVFVESLKPQLKDIVLNDSSITVEDVVANSELISKAWDMANSYVSGQTSPVNKEVAVTAAVVKETEEEVLAMKIDKAGRRDIAIYLANNGVPSYIIQSIVKSYRKYPLRYLDRIPEKGEFTLWQYSGQGENLLKLAMVAIHHGLNIRLEGGKGAGKNTLLKTIAWVTQRPYFSQSANRDTDITHLFGDKTIEVEEINGQAVQKVVFQKELLIEAMEVGGIYELGEGNACRPEVTMALHSILDSRREVDVNGYKLVKAHPEFVFTTTMNLDYEGCNSMNQAFRDRFITLQFPSPTSIEDILKETCPNASVSNVKICDKMYSDILARVGELQSDEIVTIRGYINALTMAEDVGIKTALKICVAQNVTDDIMLREELIEMIDNAVV